MKSRSSRSDGSGKSNDPRDLYRENRSWTTVAPCCSETGKSQPNSFPPTQDTVHIWVVDVTVVLSTSQTVHLSNARAWRNAARTVRVGSHRTRCSSVSDSCYADIWFGSESDVYQYSDYSASCATPRPIDCSGNRSSGGARIYSS